MFIDSFNKYLLNTDNVSRVALGLGDTEIIKTSSKCSQPSLVKSDTLGGKTTHTFGKEWSKGNDSTKFSKPMHQADGKEDRAAGQDLAPHRLPNSWQMAKLPSTY